jgi:hypothetical protein
VTVSGQSGLYSLPSSAEPSERLCSRPRSRTADG